MARSRRRRRSAFTRRRPRRGRGSGPWGFILGAVLISALVVAAILAEPFFDPGEPLTGPVAVSVYLVDTSGSQSSSGGDAAGQAQNRERRLRSVIRQATTERGVLILSTFASDAQGVSTLELDLSDSGVGCAGNEGNCAAVRSRRQAEALVQATDFIETLQPTGSTDVVNAGFRRAALIALSEPLETDPIEGPRRIFLESDFLDSQCLESDAQSIVERCLIPLDGLEQLHSATLLITDFSQGATLAEVQAAGELFLATCEILLPGRCEQRL